MTDKSAPKIDKVPGLKWRKTATGWIAFWRARHDIAERGFLPRYLKLFDGIEPTELERAAISDTCVKLQAAMLIWSWGGLPEVGVYDGTIASLAHCYLTDPDSTFRKNRYRTRQNYTILIKRIVRDHGDEMVADLKGRDMLRWHEAWSASGVPMAHSLMRMVRGILSFGLTLLECEQCTRLCMVMSKQRYKMGKSREEQLTAEQVVAVRAKAHEVGLPAIALAQAIQFECTFRQKDVIGEWIPESEPGLSEVLSHDKHGKGIKWLCGVRWNEIDEHLILRHVTSKKQKPMVVDLRNAPMVLEEFRAIFGSTDRAALPASGPIIVEARDGLPYHDDKFRQEWRDLARAIGIPDKVKNMDSRAGAITEATDSGVALEDARHAAAHSNIQTTQRYSRGAAEKTARAMQSRAAFRDKNKSGT